MFADPNELLPEQKTALQSNSPPTDPAEKETTVKFWQRNYHPQVNARIYADLRQPFGREAAVTLAWVLYNVGREAEAMRYLSAAARAGTITPESTYYAAKILVGRGSQQSARNLLENLLNQRRAFLHRPEAQQLLEKIRPSSGAEPGSGS